MTRPALHQPLHKQHMFVYRTINILMTLYSVHCTVYITSTFVVDFINIPLLSMFLYRTINDLTTLYSYSYMTSTQGWEFAHSLIAHSLIHSFTHFAQIK